MHKPDDSRIKLTLGNEAATTALAARMAPCIKPGLVVYLHGDLGAGKTTLVRALLQALGYKGRVKSPTYTLLEQYEVSGVHLRHFDLYRFHSEEEWDAAGFRDEFDGKNVCFVEWPDKAQDLLPQADLELRIEILSNIRNMEILANSQTGRECIKKLQP